MCGSGNEPRQSEPDEGLKSGHTSTQSVSSDQPSKYEFASGTIPLPRRTNEKGHALSIRNRSHVLCAGSPHAKKTTPRPVSLAWFRMALRTASTKDSHPFFACELALWARTVRQILSQRTPALARGVRSLDGCHHDLRNGVVKVSATRGTKERGKRRERGY